MPKALKQKQEYGIPLSRYTVFLQNCPLGHDPKAIVFFQLNPSFERNKSASQMKSLRDEIAFGEYRDGFNFIDAARL